MPSLEWEENVFLGLKAFYQAVFTTPKERAAQVRQATLAAQRSTLLLLGKMLSGHNLALFETEDPLLYVADRICLPNRIFLGSSVEINTECYLLRTVAAAIALRYRLDATNSSLKSVLTLCGQQLPEFTARLHQLREQCGEQISLSRIFPRLPTPAELLTTRKQDVANIDPGAEPDSKTVTEIVGQGHVQVVDVTEGDSGQQDTPFHTFEKVETLEEYSGLSRQTDADDDLLEHQEALSKLKIDSVLRSTDRSESVYKADIMLDGVGFEVCQEQGIGLPYPEWDPQRRSYRKNWCFVQTAPATRVDSVWPGTMLRKHGSLITTLKKRFAAVITEWLKMKRQIVGDDFDLDAIIELVIRQHTRESPPENLYVGRQRRFPDITTLILLDTSYSTDSWVQNLRVLDVIKETIFCVSEVLADAQQGFGIFGFASNTRQQCRVTPIKRFEDTWQKARSALGGIEPGGYTRIGAVLRHSYAKLLPAEAAQKLVILITDGKPCDYDRYEGEYGIGDVRKAISEGKTAGIMTHAFAIDRQARNYFPRMFSKSDYDIISQPERLVGVLFQVYLKLMLRNC